MALLYNAWYKKYPQSSFHTFNDNQEWKQMDKMGHVFSAYTMSKWSREIWRKYGMNERQSLLIGGLSGALYQTIIEVLDGCSSQWGWSWGDIFSNVTGSGLFIGQELLWKEQGIQLKTSFHKINYLDAELNNRSNELFGKSLPERLLKDYNGQTYWLSVNLKDFYRTSNIPNWLNIAVGTGAENMFGAKENISRNANGTIVFDKTQLPRYRQWYLAPDIDFTKIKTGKKGIRIGLYILNSLKFPTPSLLLENGKIKFRPIVF